LQEAEIADSELLKARKDAPILLDLVDETLHEMPFLLS
jgi:hypothetical protein